jgi:hypothetical protein
MVLYSLFLGEGILGRYRPPVERHLGVLGFVILSGMLLGRGLPLLIVPLLTFFLVAFLQRAR